MMLESLQLNLIPHTNDVNIFAMIGALEYVTLSTSDQSHTVDTNKTSNSRNIGKSYLGGYA